MIVKDTHPATVMGFARYERSAEGAAEELIDAVIDWQEQFLAHQEGILLHAFLGNLKGQYADVILAADETSFQQMAQNMATAETAQAMLKLLDRDSIRLCQSRILKVGVAVPTQFSCVEFGAFDLAAPIEAGAEQVKAASDHIETSYLNAFANTKAHFVGQIDDRRFCEVVFGRTLGATRRNCLGYVGNPDCQPLLDLADPESMDLDFWFVLA